MNCSFRLLTYHACQHAELRFGPIIRAWQLVVRPWTPYEPSTRLGPCRAVSEVHWYDIIPYHCAYLNWSDGDFSASTDSQTVVGTSQRPGYDAIVMLWHIHVSVREKPAQTPIPSFFDSDMLLKDPVYDVFGCLVTRSAVMDYQLDSHSQDWEVIDPYSESKNQSASAFISLHDIQSSRSCHCIFRGLKTYKLLLYATGIVIIDTQAMVLMRIDVNTKDQHITRIWIRINEGDALQPGHSPLRNRQLEVSKDGMTLAHLQHCSDDDCSDPDIMLRRWNTATGTILSTDYLPGSRKWKTADLLGLSTDGTMFLIYTKEEDKLRRDIIVSSNTDNASGNIIPLEKLRDVVFFPDDRKIAYVTDKDLVIRDIRAEKETFRHPFPHAEGARSIVVTPDGKTLVTVHSSYIRTWRVEAL